MKSDASGNGGIIVLDLTPSSFIFIVVSAPLFLRRYGVYRSFYKNIRTRMTRIKRIFSASFSLFAKPSLRSLNILTLFGLNKHGLCSFVAYKIRFILPIRVIRVLFVFVYKQSL